MNEEEYYETETINIIVPVKISWKRENEDAKKEAIRSAEMDLSMRVWSGYYQYEAKGGKVEMNEETVSVPKALLEDLIDNTYELKGVREWWEDEPRLNYSEEHARYVNNIEAAEKILKGNGDNIGPCGRPELCILDGDMRPCPVCPNAESIHPDTKP